MNKITKQEIYEIIEQYNSLSVIPKGIRKYSETHIFDENQTVLWNMQKTTEHNELYEKTRKKLRQHKVQLFTNFHTSLTSYIQQETGLSFEKADFIYEYLYNEYSVCGFGEMLYNIDKIIELVNFVREAS